MNKEFVNETIQDIIIERDGYLEQVKELQQELDKYKNVIKNIREYMSDIDYKMGWQYVNYLDELLVKNGFNDFLSEIDD